MSNCTGEFHFCLRKSRTLSEFFQEKFKEGLSQGVLKGSSLPLCYNRYIILCVLWSSVCWHNSHLHEDSYFESNSGDNFLYSSCRNIHLYVAAMIQATRTWNCNGTDFLYMPRTIFIMYLSFCFKFCLRFESKLSTWSNPNMGEKRMHMNPA